MGDVPVRLRRSYLKTGAFRKLSAGDPPFTWSDVLRAFWSFLEHNKAKFVFFNALLFLVFFYELVPPFIMGKVVDFFTYYHKGDSLRLFYWYTLFLTASYLIISIIRLLSKNVLSKIAIAIKSQARIRGFERLMDASIEWHAEENTGNKVQRILTGSQAIFELVKLSSGNLYPILVSFVGVSLFYLFTSWTLFLFIVVYTTVFLLILFSFNKKIEELSIAQDRALEKSSGAYVEGAGNILSIKAAGAEKHLNSKVHAQETDVKNFMIALTDTNNRKWRFFQIWNGLAYGALLLLIGFQVVSGVMSVGFILVLYTYFNKLRDAANDTNDIGTILVGFKVDLGRLMSLFKVATKVRSGVESFPKDWKEINIKNADFIYQNKQAGLVDFNFNITRGARVGIAGASGSGKSTLVKILLGLYELKKGEFKVDDVDFYDIAHEEISNNVAVVLQEVELFNLSLLENITMMRDFDKELFDHAVEVADLKEVISRLPEGLETFIGERGYSLSGGERQRLGIARAIYKNCPIIILDEATSALDSQTEKNIIDKLFSKFNRDKTFIIIAHRLSTLRNADRVITMEKGSVVESGKFDELIKKPDTKFGCLYALQKQ